jgi:hypothetical protein
MTEINVFDAKGKIVFRSVEPRVMNHKEVDKELAKWAVKTSGRKVQIVYNE